jgi:hypothetical protein
MGLRSLLVLLGAASSSALVVGTPATTKLAVSHPAPARFGQTFMGSKEDKEFEEWARQKKIASGVDPDEDFATGRRAEGFIYAIGGELSTRTKCPLHQLDALPPATSHSHLMHLCLLLRCHHHPCAGNRWNLGIQRGLSHAAVNLPASEGTLRAEGARRASRDTS